MGHMSVKIWSITGLITCRLPNTELKKELLKEPKDIAEKANTDEKTNPVTEN